MLLIKRITHNYVMPRINYTYKWEPNSRDMPTFFFFGVTNKNSIKKWTNINISSKAKKKKKRASKI